MYVTPKQFGAIFFCGAFFTLTLFFVFSRATDSKYLDRSDFVQFYTGAVIAKDDLSKLYDHQTQIKVQSTYFEIFDRSFRSLPFVAMILKPLAFTNPKTAQDIMLGAMLAAFIIVIGMYSSSTKDFIFKVIVTGSYYPLVLAVYNIQVSLMVAAAVGLGILLLKKNYCGIAGIILATVLLKPQFMLLPILLVETARDKIKYLLGLGVSCIGLLSIGSDKLGIAYPLKYLTFLTETENGYFGTNHFELSSLQTFFAHVNYELANKLTLYTVLVLLPIAIYLYFKFSSRLSFTEQVLVAMLLTIALSLHSFIFDSLMLIFPLFSLYEEKQFRLSKFLYFLPFTTLIAINYVHALSYLGIAGYLLLVKARTRI